MLLASIGMLFAFLLPCTPWFYHIIPTLSLSVLLLTYFIVATVCYSRSFEQQFFILLTSGVFLTFPLIYTIHFYRQMFNSERNISQQQLAEYINQQPGPHSVLCLSSTGDCFPLVYMTNSDYAGRYPGLWWYRGLRKNNRDSVDRSYLIGTVVQDLNRHRAKWVIFNTRHVPYSMLTDFMQNSFFKEAWGHYRHVMTVDKTFLYERTNP
jgi:hypothetical protein